MAPLTKDTLEAANTTTEAAVPKIGAPAKSTQAGGNLRADAVSLEIPVKIHGSKVTEVVREVTPHTEPFEEQTFTMIVFPQGGVLRMSTSVSVGQMLVVTNSKTRQDAICRVVKVRTFSNLQGYVEVEFTHPQPGYWGVYFPSDGSSRPNKAAPSVATSTPESSAHETPAPPVSSAPEISWAPAASNISSTQKPLDAIPFAAKPATAAPVPAAPASKPESTFISIGSQEKVQPSASATVTTRPAAPVKTQTESAHEPAIELPKPISVFNFPSAPPPPASPSLSMDELRGDASADSSVSLADSSTDSDSAVAEEESPRTDNARGTFGSFSGGASLGTSRPGSPELFAAGVESAANASADHAAVPRQNGMLIGVCLLVLFGGVAAGVFYFRNYVNRPVVNSNPAVVSQPAPAASATAPPAATNVPLASHPKTNSAPANTASTVTPAPIANSSAPGTPASAVVNTPEPSATTQPSAPAKRSASSVTSKMMDGTLAGHPVSSQRAASGDTDADVAPSVDATPSPSSAADGAMPGIMGSSRVAAPPEPDIRPQGPVVVGGNVKEPRLVYYAPPVYPLVAQEANVQGDVVVKTTVDEAGHVTHMDVVSGPTMLRQPAIDALKRWRYEPSKLNGQPIAIQMLVTIKFHH